MSYDDKFDASLDLLRRLNPQKVSSHLNDICTLVNDEELTQDLLSSVDVPLQSRTCPETGKEFLCCDYNRDGDSYRSPWSNKYVPAVVAADDEDQPPFPSDTLRQLEIKANESFDIYRDLYYEGGGISSVYLWDTAEDEEDAAKLEGFAGVVLLKKQTDDKSGKWDSIHVFEVIPEGSNSALYKVTSSVILDLTNSALKLSGSLTRQLEQSSAFGSVNLETSHLVNVGTLIEKSEYNLRNLLQDVYFDKLNDIVMKDLRSSDLSSARGETEKQTELIKGLQEL